MTMAKVEQEKKKYFLVIKPAIPPRERHRIEDVLEELDYKVIGSGTAVNMSECDISFEE